MIARVTPIDLSAQEFKSLREPRKEKSAQDKQGWKLKRSYDKAGKSAGRTRQKVDGRLDSAATFRNYRRRSTTRRSHANDAVRNVAAAM